MKKVVSSLPQGDPFAPIAFVLLLQAASSDLRRPPDVQGASQTLFIDDRNIIANGPGQAVATIHRWNRWTHRLGLTEKLMVVAKRVQDEAALHRPWELRRQTSPVRRVFLAWTFSRARAKFLTLCNRDGAKALQLFRRLMFSPWHQL